MNDKTEDAMKVQLTAHRARLDGKEYRVIQPRHDLRQATLRDGKSCFILRMSRECVWQFAAVWELASRSPRSIIYLPIRRNPLALDSVQWQGDYRPLDLVLVDHSLQLRPSAWPRIRAQLRDGQPESAEFSTTALRERADQPRNPRLHDRENLDRFVHHVYAETLFLTGSKAVFADTVGEFSRVADHPSVHPDFETYCGEFDVVDKPRWPVDVTELFIGHTELWPPTPA